MKITQVLSASVLAGAVLFSGTACSALGADKKPEPTSSSSAATVAPTADAKSEPSESASTEAAETVSEEQEVADVVNGYYTYALLSGSLAEIKQVGERFNGRSSVTDAELDELVTSLPQGFQYFDTSAPQLIKNAYIHLLSGASVGETMPNAEIVMPASAVTIEGDKATINSTMAEITNDGNPVASNADPYAADLINLKKNDSGSWVIVADPPVMKK